MDESRSLHPIPAPYSEVGPAIARLRRRTTWGDLARNVLLNTVGDAVDGITVNGIAVELGMTQSVASRTVTPASSRDS